MKKYNSITRITVLVVLAVFVCMNMWLFRKMWTEDKIYMVDVERAAFSIEENGITELKLHQYPSVLRIVEGGENPSDRFYYGEGELSIFRKIGNSVYRFDCDQQMDRIDIVLRINLYLAVLVVVLLAILIYVRRKIILPFVRLEDMPVQLARGNLTMPLGESKDRFFGKFLWGMDVLREKLEEEKNRELQFQKNQKTLILSITHDLKTPLSAIRLYVQALQKKIYKEPEKKEQVLEQIKVKIGDIECYLQEIIDMSQEEIIPMDVRIEDIYLSELINKIIEYYKDKAEYLKVNFLVDRYNDFMIQGDMDRLEEVLQNIMENAVKYGKGSDIHMSFAEEEDCSIIFIESGNCTLTDSEMTNIFNSLWRGSNSENIQGNGLGLYICRQLMRKMNGDIFAEKNQDRLKIGVVLNKV